MKGEAGLGVWFGKSGYGTGLVIMIFIVKTGVFFRFSK
jgi:hypothetical protein